MKQSRTVSNNSVTFPIFPQIVAWTEGYMVYDNKTIIINVTVTCNSLFWTEEWSYKLKLFSTFNDDAVYAAQGAFHFEACMR